MAAEGGGGPRLPRLYVAVFAGAEASGERIAAIARSDIDRSGAASLVPEGSFPLGYNDPIAFDVFAQRGVDLLLVGTARLADEGQIEVRYRVYDVALERSLDATQLPAMVSADPVRLGHRIADALWRGLTGTPGSFSSRLALVVKRDGRYLLQVADWDGSNPQLALASVEPLLSPAWSPDGHQLAYATIEGGRPVVYTQSLATGQRQLLAKEPGSNSAPAWRPDGSGLAVVMSQGGGSRIVEGRADGANWRRVMRGAAISTEPNYSADGRSLYFTSDRSGTPQIYRATLADGVVERLSFEGDYNVSPAVSPDARQLAYVTRRGDRYCLALMDLASRRVSILDDTREVESPSYSPNGRFVAYVDRPGGRGALAVVTRDGMTRLTLPSSADDILEAAWGPASE